MKVTVKGFPKRPGGTCDKSYSEGLPSWHPSESADSAGGLVHGLCGLSASVPPQTYHTAAMRQDRLADVDPDLAENNGRKHVLFAE